MNMSKSILNCIKMDIDTLKELLLKIRIQLRKQQKEKWNRSLSFEEELFDRWERAKFLGFGTGTSIHQSSMVYGDVKVGKDTWIGPYTILDGSGGLEIGDNCSISTGVQIYSHDSVEKRVSDRRAKVTRDKTTIDNSCYIGPMAVIRKGITISNNSIIGAYSYVNKSVSPYTIVAGIPAKKIGKLKVNDKGQVEYIYKKEKDKFLANEKEIDKLKKKIEELEKRIKKDE